MQADRPTWWSNDEWETPDEIVQGFEAEFGPFDLDPCARAASAKAEYYYTKADDGLHLPWEGRIWVNPPYSRPAPWLQKAIEETTAKRATLVVVCLPSVTDTGWFHDLVLPHAEVRYRRGRIKFLGWHRTPIGSPRQGTLFALYRS